MGKRNLVDEMFKLVEHMNKHKEEVILKAEDLLSDKSSANTIEIEWGDGSLVFMYLKGVMPPVFILQNADEATVGSELSNALEVLEIYLDVSRQDLLSDYLEFAFLAKDDLGKLQHSAEEIENYFSPLLNSQSNQSYLVLNGKRNQAWRDDWRKKYC